ncbi:hypothetical protein, partial [Streptomyces sp. NPDC058086]|uniref:hypothetical protein n=1 Tax=Streptomyces sp. NPDC058086 TaxID=3346334 RepID=UPI0036E46C76
MSVRARREHLAGGRQTPGQARITGLLDRRPESRTGKPGMRAWSALAALDDCADAVADEDPNVTSQLLTPDTVTLSGLPVPAQNSSRSSPLVSAMTGRNWAGRPSKRSGPAA